MFHWTEQTHHLQEWIPFPRWYFPRNSWKMKMSCSSCECHVEAVKSRPKKVCLNSSWPGSFRILSYSIAYAILALKMLCQASQTNISLSVALHSMVFLTLTWIQAALLLLSFSTPDQINFIEFHFFFFFSWLSDASSLAFLSKTSSSPIRSTLYFCCSCKIVFPAVDERDALVSLSHSWNFVSQRERKREKREKETFSCTTTGILNSVVVLLSKKRIKGSRDEYI